VSNDRCDCPACRDFRWHDTLLIVGGAIFVGVCAVAVALCVVVCTRV